MCERVCVYILYYIFGSDIICSLRSTLLPPPSPARALVLFLSVSERHRRGRVCKRGEPDKDTMLYTHVQSVYKSERERD